MLSGIKSRFKAARSSISSGKGWYYRKSLVLSLVMSSIPGIIIGGIIYWIAGGTLENELHQMHNNQINQRAQNIEDQFAFLEMSLAHWAFDPKFSYDLKDFDFAIDFERSRDITKTLLVMQGSHPLAKQVELYLKGPKSIRFNPEHGVLENPILIQDYNFLLTQSKSVYWTNLETEGKEQDLALLHKIPGGLSEPFGFLLVRLDKSKVINLLKTLTPYNEGETFIMQGDGRSIVAGGDFAKPFDEALKTQVLQSNSAQGSFILDWHESKYTVSFGTLSRIGTGWIYVSAAPISAITRPVVLISKIILIVSCLILILAMVFSWWASRKIYSPMDRLVRLLNTSKSADADIPEHNDEFLSIENQWQYVTRESLSFRSKLEEQLPYLKESFLLQLIKGYLYSYTEQSLMEWMKNYGWTVQNRKYLMMYVKPAPIYGGGLFQVTNFALVL